MNNQSYSIGGDVLHAGIATHYCDSSRLPVIERALLTLRHSNDVEYVLNNHCPKLKSEFSLAKHLHQINKSFTASSVEGILSNLERDSSEWAKRTIKVCIFDTNWALSHNLNDAYIAVSPKVFTYQLKSSFSWIEAWFRAFIRRMFTNGISFE